MTDHWTPEQDAILRELWESHDLAAREIAHQIGRSRNAVIGRARRLGCSSKKKLSENGGWEKPREAKPSRPKRTASQIGQDGALALKMKSGLRQTDAPRAPVVDTPYEPMEGRFTLDELDATACRWPHGDGPYTFCGAPRITGSSYCKHHRSRAYVSGRAEKQVESTIEFVAKKFAPAKAEAA